ncbi:MAG TPA: ABC transporter substrate-binding protein, partial [Burkholderiaceae bacterium]|nr:ABC transporter substrate-binding protein [Burkholderiaceae bacterium]
MSMTHDTRLRQATPRRAIPRRDALKKIATLAFAAPAASTSLAARAQRARDAYGTLGYAPPAEVPAGYPASYEAQLRAAEDERDLLVYGTTDLAVAQPLIHEFERLYPRIVVHYEDLGSTELHYRFVAERQLGRPSADVIWSVAMDQQAALVQHGFADAYASPELAALPAWAHWDQRLFATTYEPVAIAYHRKTWSARGIPRTRKALADALASDLAALRGRTSTYNIEKSGVGFMLATADAQMTANYWELIRALGPTEPRLLLTTDAMLRRVASADTVLAYNVLGAYALEAQRRNPAIEVVFPEDGTLVASRLALISNQAPHPNAARLWIDFLLSQHGQSVAASRSGLIAVRPDVEGEHTAKNMA